MSAYQFKIESSALPTKLSEIEQKIKSDTSIRLSSKLTFKDKKTWGDRLPFLADVLFACKVFIMSKSDDYSGAIALKNLAFQYKDKGLTQNQKDTIEKVIDVLKLRAENKAKKAAKKSQVAVQFESLKAELRAFQIKVADSTQQNNKATLPTNPVSPSAPIKSKEEATQSLFNALEADVAIRRVTPSDEKLQSSITKNVDPSHPIPPASTPKDTNPIPQQQPFVAPIPTKPGPNAKILEIYLAGDLDSKIKKANDGDVQAMLELGAFFLEAIKDILFSDGTVLFKALEWYEAAAKKGCVEGMYEAGNLHIWGGPIPYNIEKSLEHFESAANLGHVPSMMALGEFYTEGSFDNIHKQEPNHQKAIEMYNRAYQNKNATPEEKEHCKKCLAWWGMKTNTVCPLITLEVL